MDDASAQLKRPSTPGAEVTASPRAPEDVDQDRAGTIHDELDADHGHQQAHDPGHHVQSSLSKEVHEPRRGGEHRPRDGKHRDDNRAKMTAIRTRSGASVISTITVVIAPGPVIMGIPRGVIPTSSLVNPSVSSSSVVFPRLRFA